MALAAVCSMAVVLLLLIHCLLLLSHCFVGVVCLVPFYCKVLSDVSNFDGLLYFNCLLMSCDLCLSTAVCKSNTLTSGCKNRPMAWETTA